jgi:hypothetical protein
MRVFLLSLAGSVIGAFCGLACFLVILLGPSSAPDDGDGGIGALFVLSVIAAGFAAAGVVVGCLAGLLVGQFSAPREGGNAGPPYPIPEDDPKKPPPRGIWDEYFDR